MRSSAAARMRRDETQGVLGIRTPPPSIEAEQAVLGGLLLESTAFDNIADIVRDEDFCRPDHRVIFGCLRRGSSALTAEV
jgi:replicative DNA helicase